MLNKFVKNVGIMSIAPIFTQLLSFFIMPIVTRLYFPNDFGLFAIYASIIGPLGVFSTMGYSTAILIPKEDSEASNLFSLSLFFTLIIALFSIILIILCDDLSIASDMTLLKDYRWLIPFGLLFHGLYMSLRYWNLRKKRFNHISSANFFRFLANNGVMLIAGFSGFASALYMIIGDIFGGIVSLSILNRSVWKENSQLFKNHIRISKMIELAKSYSKYPKYIMLTDFLNQFMSQMPVYILSIYFSQNIIGLYALGLRLLTMPINLIGNAIGEVFFQSASEDNKQIDSLLEYLYKYLVLLAIPIFSFLGILGKEIFHIFFGSNWSEAGIYSQILCLFIFTKFITIPAHFLMLIYEKQEYSILLNIAIFVVSIISLVIGGILDNVYLSFILYSVSNSLVYGVYGFGFMRYSGLALSKMSNMFFKSFLKCSSLILILIFLKIYANINEIQLVVISSFLLGLFYIILAILTPEIKNIWIQTYFKLKTKLS